MSRKNRDIGFAVAILWLLVAMSAAWGQERKPLSDAAATQWSQFSGGLLSPDGQWVAYHPHYPHGRDTFFIQHVHDRKKHYAFAGGSQPVFSGDGSFAALVVKDKGLVLLDLKTGRLDSVPDATSVQLLEAGRYLAIELQRGGERILQVRQHRSTRVVLEARTAVYSINPQGNALVYQDSTAAGLTLHGVAFQGASPVMEAIKSLSKGGYSKLAWTRSGDAVVFLGDGRLMRYIMPSGGSLPGRLDELADGLTPQGQHIPIFAQLVASDDHQRVFFQLTPDTIPPIDSLVEVWHARDSWIYPHRDGQRDWSGLPKLWVWLPEQGIVRQLSDNAQPYSEFAGDQRHVLTYNPMWHEPQVKQIDDVDVYLTDAMTGERKLLIQQLENGLHNSLRVSPGGRYIAYFKGGHWWSYSIQADTHIKLTDGVGVSLETTLGSSLTDGSVYAEGIAGWTTDDQGLIVYDEYDCWLLSPDGAAAKRLTDGRAQGIRFRHYAFLYGGYGGRDFGGEVLDLRAGIVLEARDSRKARGYYFLSDRKAAEPLFFDGQLSTQSLRRASAAEAFVFTESRYDLPPRLKYWKKGMKNAQLIYQSNPHYREYDWGHAELVSYRNSKNEALQGALFYPAGYVPSEKYPMIVQVYQHLSGTFYEYENPTEATGGRLPIVPFTAQGYLVFCPDIDYTMGDPGMSALDCVEQAVRAVIAKGVVDQAHIGLTGHSHGGYETAFIMTQSKLFATAIAGAPITDLVKGYLTINEEYMHTADSWRYETQQQRFGFSFYDNKAAYLRNSPVHQAKGINSPILIWTGQEDRNVHWQQSHELYFALRRLNKPGAMLVYPDEHHVLMQEAHQKDLYRRMSEWFGYYLNGELGADWITTPQN